MLMMKDKNRRTFGYWFKIDRDSLYFLSKWKFH